MISNIFKNEQLTYTFLFKVISHNLYNINIWVIKKKRIFYKLITILFVLKNHNIYI